MPERRIAPASILPAPAAGSESPARRRSRLARYLAPKEPIPRTLALVLGLSFFGLVVAAWAIASYTSLTSDYFLPTPVKVARTLYDMFVHQGFLHDVWASTYRIMAGFVIASAIAVPLGIAIGAFRVVQAFFEPLIAAVRYMPASAFIPLLIIWLGIGNGEKIGVIWFGVFFPLALLIADVSANVPKEFINIAYTLGASRRHVFFRVLVPACWPGVLDNLRIAVGWAWTYLIVAELVAANTGIGHVILSASRSLQTEQIMGGILTIGFLGLLTDAIFRWLHRQLFPYTERAAS